MMLSELKCSREIDIGSKKYWFDRVFVIAVWLGTTQWSRKVHIIGWVRFSSWDEICVSLRLVCGVNGSTP